MFFFFYFLVFPSSFPCVFTSFHLFLLFHIFLTFLSIPSATCFFSLYFLLSFFSYRLFFALLFSSLSPDLCPIFYLRFLPCRSLLNFFFFPVFLVLLSFLTFISGISSSLSVFFYFGFLFIPM